MKKTILFIFLVLISLGADAQRRKRVKTPPEPTPEELAEQARREKYDKKLQSTQRITFIDSVLLTKSEVLENICIGEESGHVFSCNEFFNNSKGTDTLDCTLFRSQLGDKIVFSQPDAKGLLQLYACEKIGDSWSEKMHLKGLNDTVNTNYPFMLSDGATMYYSCVSEDGLGGYDIYMTRWDDDEKLFLKAENIGMPFNSESNDYLYIIDEFNNLGWFLTDRGMNQDSVCLYCFIPNEVRKIYNANAMGRDTLVAYANIHSIKDTWDDMNQVTEAQKRLSNLKNKAKKTTTAKFKFIIDDNITYTNLSHFRIKESKMLAEKWLDMNKELNVVSKELDKLRYEYSLANDKAKNNMTLRIKELEDNYERLIYDIRSLEKEIRSFEQR